MNPLPAWNSSHTPLPPPSLCSTAKYASDLYASPYFFFPSLVFTSHRVRNASKNSSRSVSVSDMSSRRTYLTHTVLVNVRLDPSA